VRPTLEADRLLLAPVFRDQSSPGRQVNACPVFRYLRMDLWQGKLYEKVIARIVPLVAGGGSNTALETEVISPRPLRHLVECKPVEKAGRSGMSRSQYLHTQRE
jgi:hypothetical protein